MSVEYVDSHIGEPLDNWRCWAMDRAVRAARELGFMGYHSASGRIRDVREDGGWNACTGKRAFVAGV